TGLRQRSTPGPPEPCSPTTSRQRGRRWGNSPPARLRWLCPAHDKCPLNRHTPRSPLLAPTPAEKPVPEIYVKLTSCPQVVRHTVSCGPPRALKLIPSTDVPATLHPLTYLSPPHPRETSL